MEEAGADGDEGEKFMSRLWLRVRAQIAPRPRLFIFINTVAVLT